ncbi:PALP domain-containing protein [Salininema proteolyticum]|uniref:Threonine dehydratase n=1 Tax=Salininema proteolyticum TaxID=1607685 RepID=A0ABV8U3F6_9ACTN
MTDTDVKAVLVSDTAIVEAPQNLWGYRRISVEHGAATALAALTAGAYVPKENERWAVVRCGANTDPCSLNM